MHIRNRLSPRSHPTSSRTHGFTLIEILTATAIMALLVSLVMTILSQVVTAWNRSSDELDIGGKARSALDLVAADLQMALFRQDGTQWLSLSTETTPNSPVSGVTNSRLIFFTSTPVHQSKDETNGGVDAKPIYGDICAVEYRVTYADPFGSTSSVQKTFSLHRVVVDPGSTFYGINKKPIMGIYNGTTNGGKNTLEDNFDALFDNLDHGVSNSVPGPQSKELTMKVYGSLTHESILLDNVARFNVFLYYYGANGSPPPATEVFPETYPAAITTNPAKYYYGGWQRKTGAGIVPSGPQPGFLDLVSPSILPAGSPTFYRLAFADITMTVLKDEGVTLLNQFNGSMPSNMTWEDFLNRYGITYTERIRFYNSPS